MEFFPLCLRNN